MMRKVFMILILSIIPLVGICQPRSNGTDKYKVISQSQVITNPIGWCYSTYDEKWCGCYGICIGEYRRNSKTPRRLTASDIAGYGDDGGNFQYIHVSW